MSLEQMASGCRGVDIDGSCVVGVAAAGNLASAVACDVVAQTAPIPQFSMVGIVKETHRPNDA